MPSLVSQMLFLNLTLPTKIILFTNPIKMRTLKCNIVITSPIMIF